MRWDAEEGEENERGVDDLKQVYLGDLDRTPFAFGATGMAH